MRVVVVLWLLGCVTASAQTKNGARPAEQTIDTAGPAATRVNVDVLPISLARISEELGKTPALELGATRPTFRVQIFGTRPRWTTPIDWLGTADGRRPPAGAPWHTQFVDMVTPPEARGFGAFQGTDLLQVMGTSLVQGLAAGAVIGKIKSTVKERRERKAREEVDAAIAAWRTEQDAAAARAQAAAAAETPP